MEGWGPVLKECGLPTPANSRLSKHGQEKNIKGRRNAHRTRILERHRGNTPPQLAAGFRPQRMLPKPCTLLLYGC